MLNIDLIENFFNTIRNRQFDNLVWNQQYLVDYNSEYVQKFLLNLQLNSKDDRGSRKITDIMYHVDWIHTEVLRKKSSKILDLGCGPGFYSYYLSAKGHHCYGIDISNMAIHYAKAITASKWLSCEFVQNNMFNADLPIGNDLVIMPYSIFNELKEEEAKTFLEKILSCLKPGKFFYLEALSFQPPKEEYFAHWYSSNHESIFCEGPHLCLSEQFWHPNQKIIAYRVFIISLTDLVLKQFITTQKLYTFDDYHNLFISSGFTDINFPNSPPGTAKGDDKAYCSILARKK